VQSLPSGPPGSSLLWPLSALVRRRTMLMRAARDQLAVGRRRGGAAAAIASSGPSFSMPSDGIDSTELQGAWATSVAANIFQGMSATLAKTKFILYISKSSMTPALHQSTHTTS